MKISSISIKNFRSFRDITIPFNDYACLVGPNGAGKSTVLYALNTFFRETQNVSTNLSLLSREDFHHGNVDDPIEITITFTDLNEEAQEDFSDYYRQGKLVISAVANFNEGTDRAEVKQQGQRLGMEDFKPFFKAFSDKASAADLKTIYTKIKLTYPDLAAPGSKEIMYKALNEYEAAHEGQCVLIPSDDQFYGFSKGVNRLAKHVQWVYVPAVKDASTEQIEGRNTALGKLLERTVRSKVDFDASILSLRNGLKAQYDELLKANQGALDDLSESLRARLSEWAHPGATLRLQWTQDPDKSVQVHEPFASIIAGEGEFEGDLARFGHGLQRSYLLALLQELANGDDPDGPRLILGCEEPELYQHPPQARHLADVLKKLSDDNTQIIVSTHNPVFVSGEGFEDVRVVRRNAVARHSEVAHMSYAEVSKTIASATGEQPKKPEGVQAKINQALQPSINEMFFTPRLVLVEGLEDVAYISAYLNLMGNWDDYRRVGCHLVPVSGKSELLQPLAIAMHMSIPTYIVFDADADTPEDGGKRTKQVKDNQALLKILGYNDADPMPSDALWGEGFVMWPLDIGETVKNDVGEQAWGEGCAHADQQYGHAGNLKKNTLHIGAALAHTWDAGHRSENLERLCNAILDSENSV